MSASQPLIFQYASYNMKFGFAQRLKKILNKIKIIMITNIDKRRIIMYNTDIQNKATK